MGRRRVKDSGEPRGVRTIAGRWYYQPTTLHERDELKRKGLPASVPLGKAGSVAARTRWAEITGLRDASTNPGTIGDLLTRFNTGDPAPILTMRNGRARSPETVKQYRYKLPALYARFGGCVYARTETEILRGAGVTPGEIQKFISSSGSLGRAYLAILDAAFDGAVLDNLTTFNPCDKIKAPLGRARTREPLEWEVEALGAMARPVQALILDYKHISGYRITEILRVHRRELVAEGIKMSTKGAKRELLEWSPRLREIVAAAEKLPKATKFPASPLFPSARGKAYTYSGWASAWKKLARDVNAELAAIAVVDPDTLEHHDGLQIVDLHVHDVRSKVHDDAEAMGRPGHEQLGNTEQVADKHYARRERRRRPTR